MNEPYEVLSMHVPYKSPVGTARGMISVRLPQLDPSPRTSIYLTNEEARTMTNLQVMEELIRRAEHWAERRTKPLPI